ncbi:hypothetical protein ACQ4PT_004190 [Festuca glaucescens]
MAETGDGSRLPSPLDVLTSDVHSRLEFHKYAYIDCVGIKNALDCVIEEKVKLQQEQNAIVQLAAEKDDLTKKNEELVAEIKSLKEKLQANESSNLLQGSGFQQSQSGRAQTGSMQKRKRQSGDEDADEHELMEGLSGMDNPDQGLSTEHEGARREISDIHSTLIKEIVDVSDEKLQELCAAWGEEVYKAVVNCLTEIHESSNLRIEPLYLSSGISRARGRPLSVRALRQGDWDVLVQEYDGTGNCLYYDDNIMSS